MASGIFRGFFIRSIQVYLVSLLSTAMKMKIVFPTLFVMLCLSCTSNSSEEAYQGKPEEFFTGGMNFERDLGSAYLSFQEPVMYRGKETIYSKWNDVLIFFDPVSGKKNLNFQYPQRRTPRHKGWDRDRKGL